ncbi:MAG: hypothetical protein N3B13_07145 [Deltaproteobacteria bacterium]|nr:hypothetical protein [Deltaproteobacteria bacterium]
MYLIGKVTYSQIHSLLPREAALVTIIGNKKFSDYNAASEYCRTLKVSGDYSFVPVEILSSGNSRKKRGKGK